MDSEKCLEKKISVEVRKLGGMSIKIQNPTICGMPDRLILLPTGRMFFVELKSTGKKPQLIQLKQIALLRELGFDVRIIDNFVDLRGFINEIGGLYQNGF